MPTTIVNFSHPLTPANLDQIRALRDGLEIARVIDVPTHFTEDAPYAEQVAALTAGVGLSATEWQTLPILINPPGFASIVAILLAYLHGLRGSFPEVIRVTRDAGGGYAVAALVDLQTVRESGRLARVEGL